MDDYEGLGQQPLPDSCPPPGDICRSNPNLTLNSDHRLTPIILTLATNLTLPLNFNPNPILNPKLEPQPNPNPITLTINLTPS